MAPYLAPDNRKSVVFLGTPAVALSVLQHLLRAEALVKVVAVVTQPPARSLRGGGVTPNKVHEMALASGVPVLHPETAKDPGFLEDLRTLAPDLCVTAAYGNLLPQTFLDIPKFGTLNIHPSLLPLYRGAAPVQRAIEEGASVTGVTVAVTVFAMDAGPLVNQEIFDLSDDIQAPELLAALFELGGRSLVSILPSYFSGAVKPKEQNALAATKARKIKIEEGILDPNSSLRTLHNKVRAFAGWPGTRLQILRNGEPLEIKILKTRMSSDSTEKTVSQASLTWENGKLFLRNPSATAALELLQVQLAGKKACTGNDLWNGVLRSGIVTF